MKRVPFILFLSIVFALITTPVFAQNGGSIADEVDSFSAGVILGEPTGISAKFWLGDISAVDVALAWSFVGGGGFYFHADYLTHFFEAFDIAPDRLPLYAGIGGSVRVRGGEGPFTDDNELSVAARVPLGISFLASEVPIDLFFELAPGMQLFPEVAFDMGAAIGVRYRF